MVPIRLTPTERALVAEHAGKSLPAIVADAINGSTTVQDAAKRLRVSKPTLHTLRELYAPDARTERERKAGAQ